MNGHLHNEFAWNCSKTQLQLLPFENVIKFSKALLVVIQI